MNFPWHLEPWIRLGAFTGILLLLVALELVAPRRTLTVGRRSRWPGNLLLVALDTLLIRLLLPAAAVGTALVAEARGWGLFHVVELPAWLEIALAVVLLDLIVYGQHVLFHAAPWLWRVHRVHHADPEFDVTTGLRFHPIEIFISMGIKVAAVLLLGAAALAVLIFEVLLNASSMWSHANVRLPGRLDQLVRKAIVTPDMHRTHHSVIARETHSNFGFNLAIWDRLFGTYRANPEQGHEAMCIGLPLFRSPTDSRIDRLLLQPFRSSKGQGEQK